MRNVCAKKPMSQMTKAEYAKELKLWDWHKVFLILPHFITLKGCKEKFCWFRHIWRRKQGLNGICGIIWVYWEFSLTKPTDAS